MANLVNTPLRNLIVLSAAGASTYTSAPIHNLSCRGVIVKISISVFGTSSTWKVQCYDPLTKTAFDFPTACASAALAANVETSLIVYPGAAAVTAAAGGASYSFPLPEWWLLTVTTVGTVSAVANADLIV